MYSLLTVFCLIVVVTAQDCKVGGKPCAYHEQCCGGCCVHNTCVDTYTSCMSSFDVCRDHSCHGEQNCIVYTPPNCQECEPQAVCH